jgi:hypothetical protein
VSSVWAFGSAARSARERAGLTREGGAGTREFARARSVRFERVATRPRETPRRAHLLRGEGDQPRDPHVRLRNAAHLQVVVRQRVRYRRRELVQGFHERRDLFLGASEGPLQERDPGRGVLRRGAREGPSGRCEHGGGLRARGRGLFWVHRACPGTEGHHPPEGGKPTHRSGCFGAGEFSTRQQQAGFTVALRVHVNVRVLVLYCTRTCTFSHFSKGRKFQPMSVWRPAPYAKTCPCQSEVSFVVRKYAETAPGP